MQGRQAIGLDRRSQHVFTECRATHRHDHFVTTHVAASRRAFMRAHVTRVTQLAVQPMRQRKRGLERHYIRVAMHEDQIEIALHQVNDLLMASRCVVIFQDIAH